MELPGSWEVSLSGQPGPQLEMGGSVTIEGESGHRVIQQPLPQPMFEGLLGIDQSRRWVSSKPAQSGVCEGVSGKCLEKGGPRVSSLTTASPLFWLKGPMSWDWASLVQPLAWGLLHLLKLVGLWSSAESWLGAQILEPQFWRCQHFPAVQLMYDPV